MRDDVVYVKNGNDFTHEDRYDGEDFVFPPGEKVAIPTEAAQHFFGYGLKDKSQILTRLGWAWKIDLEKRIPVEDPTGVERLRKFTFSRAVMTEEVIPDVQEEDADPAIA